MMFNEHERHHKRKKNKTHNSPPPSAFQHCARPRPALRQSQLSSGLIGWLVGWLIDFSPRSLIWPVRTCSYCILQRTYHLCGPATTTLPHVRFTIEGDCFEPQEWKTVPLAGCVLFPGNYPPPLPSPQLPVCPNYG